jgi:hypothetical protein
MKPFPRYGLEALSWIKYVRGGYRQMGLADGSEQRKCCFHEVRFTLWTSRPLPMIDGDVSESRWSKSALSSRH